MFRLGPINLPDNRALSAGSAGCPGAAFALRRALRFGSMISPMPRASNCSMYSTMPSFSALGVRPSHSWISERLISSGNQLQPEHGTRQAVACKRSQMCIRGLPMKGSAGCDQARLDTFLPTALTIKAGTVFAPKSYRNSSAALSSLFVAHASRLKTTIPSSPPTNFAKWSRSRGGCAYHPHFVARGRLNKALGVV